ncbi:HAD family hydrolase [Klebsiella pneumoniae]|uniref:Phosphorylated carbohydrates phosphatase n=1 Tax=Klebsiella pneumoniae TaxID=573 RepID=A0A8D6Q039_KLEPN|nr:HAD-IA family hydrolase [Klebsiella pneumoniae]MBM4741151.1 HAD-IA family hydrolase [Klebsiella pneumoniae]MCM5917726.1 HAD family hydrolase [Klebsiella pneumoniae]MCP6174278.1 HAD family hydrolase [Klebsiella pneumoniae]MDZ0673611.1 HAD family hydrolase [Klebsiella pneumoniae]NWL97926.1 HAD-IA family hydrolase [Klebsiella pneumoniae]
MTRIRGVIFDMDGVLIDAREWHYNALNQALSLFGLSISREAHLGGFDGLPTREKLKRLSEQEGLPVTLHTLINNLKQRYTLQMAEKYCRPVDAHQEALAALSEQGYRLAVASNSVRVSVDTLLARAGLNQWLQFTLSNEDVSCGKPHPEIYRKAIAKLQLSPQECVVVEDNPHGIAAATAAGAHVLPVADPSAVNLSLIEKFIRQCESKKDEIFTPKRGLAKS